MSQQQQVLDYIERHGSITSREAMIELGVMRLASRVNDLRASGHKIITVMESNPNRYGVMTRYARYKLATAQ